MNRWWKGCAELPQAEQPSQSPSPSLSLRTVLSRSPRSQGWEACGKTGTAQNRGHDHSVFMGFAPMNKPKIAIAVYVENGGWGATYGVPFGALLMEQYLKGKLSPENELRAEEFSNRVILYGNEER